MIRIGSDTNIGMNRNSSNWLGMNFNPVLSAGQFYKLYWTIFFCIYYWGKRYWLKNDWFNSSYSPEVVLGSQATLTTYINQPGRPGRESLLTIRMLSVRVLPSWGLFHQPSFKSRTSWLQFSKSLLDFEMNETSKLDSKSSLKVFERICNKDTS